MPAIRIPIQFLHINHYLCPQWFYPAEAALNRVPSGKFNWVKMSLMSGRGYHFQWQVFESLQGLYMIDALSQEAGLCLTPHRPYC